MTTMLRNFIIAILFLTLLTPLVYTQDLFFLYVTGKNFYFRILVELAFAAYIILATADSTYRPRKSIILIAVLSFGSIIGLATVLSIEPSRSFWSNFERMTGYVTILHLIAFFIVASAILNTQKIWLSFLKTSLGVSALEGLSVLMLASNSGTLGNSSYLASYMLTHVFLAGFLWVQQSQEKHRILYFFVAVFDAYMLYQTGCRGAFLGLIGATLLTLTLIILFDKTSLRRLAGGFFCLIFAIALILKLCANTALVQKIPLFTRYAEPIHAILHADTKYFAKNGDDFRLVIWKVALQAAREKLLLGFGPENFDYAFNLHFPAQVMYNQDRLDSVHNVPLEWLISGGILGLASYLFLFIALLYVLWRKLLLSLAEKAVLTGLFAAYFIHNFFVFDSISSYLVFFFLLAYINFLSTHQNKPHPSALNLQVAYGLIPAVLLTLCFILYTVNFKPYRVALLLNHTSGKHTPEELFDIYQEALSYHTFGSFEIRMYLATMTVRVLDLNVSTGIKQSLINLTNTQLKKQILETPQKAWLYRTYGAFLNRIGQPEEALTNYKKTLIYSPGSLDLLQGICSLYLNKNDFETALSYCKTAFDKAPEIDDTRITYAVAAFFADQEDLVFQLLTESTREAVISKLNMVIKFKPWLQSRGEYYMNRIQSINYKK